MTRKDYVALAWALRHEKPEQSDVMHLYLSQWERDVQAIADALAEDNPCFDRQRFYSACGMES